MTPDAHMVETLRLRTAALHRVSRSNDQLRREVERLRAGESEDVGPAHAVPTPAQWLYRFNEASADERLAMAERIIANAETVNWHFIRNTRGELGHLRRRVMELEAAARDQP